jgi:ankyrin repeat protein
MNGRDAPQAMLMLAAEKGTPNDIVSAVRAGANINGRNAAGQTALTIATGPLSSEESAARVQCLLELGARVAAEDPQSGFGTSVHNSVICGHSRSLELLLQADGSVALSAFNSLGQTPLICAVMAGRFGFVRRLLDAGSPIDARDENTDGNTALAQAVRESKLAIVELLLSHGADPRIAGWMQLTPLEMVDDLHGNPDSAAKIRAMLESALNQPARRE